MHASDLSRATWRKSSYSNGTGGSCVEITILNASTSDCRPAIAVRDSKDPHGLVLAFTEEDWRDLTTRIKAGELNLP
jgi:Domain of unknown function (DUF397)